MNWVLIPIVSYECTCYIVWYAVLTCQRHDIHSSIRNTSSTIISEERKGTDGRASHVWATHGTHIFTTPHNPHSTPPHSAAASVHLHLSSVDALPVGGTTLRLWLLEVCPRHAVVLGPLSLQVLLGLGGSSLCCLGSCRKHTHTYYCVTTSSPLAPGRGLPAAAPCCCWASCICWPCACAYCQYAAQAAL